MKKISFFALLVLVMASSFYRNERKISIYLEEYNYFFTPQKSDCVDTIVEKLEDGRILKIFLAECKGRMHLVCYKGKNKIEEGNYINSLDLLKKYSKGVNALSGKRKITVKEYYQPLRSGEWLFYNDNGKLIGKKQYVEGVLGNVSD